MTLRKVISPLEIDEQLQNKRRRYLLESPNKGKQKGDSSIPNYDKYHEASEALAIQTFESKCKVEKLWYIHKYFTLKEVVKNSQGSSVLVACREEGCNSCIKYDMSAGTTSGMINHLRQVHKVFVSQKKQRSNSIAETEQPDTSPYCIYSPQYLHVTKGLLFHLIKDKQSLNSVYCSGYKFLLKKLNQRYRPPSRYFITTQAVPAIYKKCMSRMKSQIKRIGHRVSITTDGWKNICNTGFVTLTGRYAVITKDSIILKEKLLDFKTTVGAQVASTVLEQIFQQADTTGVHMSEDVPCFVTSDRGSNIKAAIASTKKLRGIPCTSHVLHRAVLEAVDQSDACVAVEKVIAMASAFSRSIPRTSHFGKWQEEYEGMRPLLPISVSRTRWHGYLDSIMRQLLIQQRIVDWIYHVKGLPLSDHLNVEPLLDYVCTDVELKQLQALAYVLWHLKIYDSVAQATTQATGVKYARVIKSILDRLAFIASYNSACDELLLGLPERDQKITKAVVQQYDSSKDRIFKQLAQKDLSLTGLFAQNLHKAVALRYTLPQLDEILLVSFFDPLWQLSLPKWALSKRISGKEQYDLEQGIKRKVVDLVKHLSPIEDQLRQPGTDNSNETTHLRSGVSPAAIPFAKQASESMPSSHQSNQQGSQDGQLQDFQHPGPAGPDDLQLSSQDSQPRRNLNVKARLENLMDREILGKEVYHGQNQYDLQWSDDEQGIIVEIKCYLGDKDNIRNTDKYVDPLAYWFDKRSVLPQLFKAALKMLSVPATSVLSEQIFSGAGNISCKQRSRLNVGTIEKLVLLQRSMAKEDVESLTGEDFKEERRAIDRARKQQIQKEAYDKVFALASSVADAADAAQNAADQYIDGTDEQMVLHTNDTLDEQDVLDGDFITIDEQLDDINEVPFVESLYEVLQDTNEGCKMLTRAKIRELTNKNQKTKRLGEYLQDGLD